MCSMAIRGFVCDIMGRGGDVQEGFYSRLNNVKDMQIGAKEGEKR